VRDVPPRPGYTTSSSSPSSSSNQGNKASDFPHLEYLAWAPTGNGYAYVYQSNIYYKESVESKNVFPITSDGVPHVVFNGVPDWVYEGNSLNELAHKHLKRRT
jgi:hypothetical protein